ncbi:hypothetical protein ILUMI_07365 [Ignelater luminosus]|uniref:MADF domain-containing protein n=1 Tax=Ignelater luminosus TaxID=2038154 RepID=A0A8K0DDN4_IGNLU|nr:hypothetical protein ILUMI_07365 [Ignelater luminosus]
MSLYKMNSTQLMQFVELYRDRDCLWSVNSPHYTDRAARNRSLQEISEAMNIPSFGPREVAQKIKNLRTTYNQQIKKIALSKSSGKSNYDLYKPRVPWFEVVDGFLGKHQHVDDVRFAASHLDEESMFAIPKIEYPDQSSDAFASRILKSNSPNIKNARERVSYLDDSDGIDYKIRKIEDSNGNEYDFFGRYVAAALKSLPTENAIAAQTRIMLALTEEKTKSKQQFERLINHLLHNWEGQNNQNPIEISTNQHLPKKEIRQQKCSFRACVHVKLMYQNLYARLAKRDRKANEENPNTKQASI